MRRWLTLYSDSLVHDDVSPVSAPRRSAVNPGIYLTHFPSIPKLDFRAEAVYTDPPSVASMGGRFIYWEVVYHDVYLDNRFLMGNWIGREGKGYQAWSTYHLSPQSSIQVAVRNSKIANDFIPGGSTQWDWSLSRCCGFTRTWKSSLCCNMKRGGSRCWLPRGKLISPAQSNSPGGPPARHTSNCALTTPGSHWRAAPGLPSPTCQFFPALENIFVLRHPARAGTFEILRLFSRSRCDILCLQSFISWWYCVTSWVARTQVEPGEIHA